MPAPGLPALDNTMGALFIGVLLAMGLWGAGSVQMYYYYDRYSKDDWRIKLLVFVVWAMDTVHQGMIIHTAYVYLITEYGNPPFMANIVPSLLYEVVVSAMLCFTVQCFLIMRVWRLSHKSYILVGGLIVLCGTPFVMQLIYVGLAIPFGTYANLTKIYNYSRSINVLSAVSDVAIAAALIILLQRSRTGFSKSESIINRLILFTINTGALTSLCAIASLISITAFPLTFIYILFYVTLCKLYTNTLFATLNARKSLRGGHPDDSENTAAGSSMSMNRIRQRLEYEGNTTLGAKSANGARALNIKVDTETTRDDGLQRNGNKRGPDGSDSDLDRPYYSKPEHAV